MYLWKQRFWSILEQFWDQKKKRNWNAVTVSNPILDNISIVFPKTLFFKKLRKMFFFVFDYFLTTFPTNVPHFWVKQKTKHKYVTKNANSHNFLSQFNIFKIHSWVIIQFLKNRNQNSLIVKTKKKQKNIFKRCQWRLRPWSKFLQQFPLG